MSPPIYFCYNEYFEANKNYVHMIIGAHTVSVRGTDTSISGFTSHLSAGIIVSCQLIPYWPNLVQMIISIQSLQYSAQQMPQLSSAYERVPCFWTLPPTTKVAPCHFMPRHRRGLEVENKLVQVYGNILYCWHIHLWEENQPPNMGHSSFGGGSLKSASLQTG